MFTIALNTIRELVRNKFFGLILILGVAFILTSFVLDTLSLGEVRRVIYDFGLSFIELTGLAVILFLGGGMLSREIEGRTIYLMLSKPIGRSQIIFGKFLGFAAVITTMVVFQAFLLLGLLIFRDISLDPLMFPALGGILLKLYSLLALILFFTSFTSPGVAMFLTIASYIIGHSGYIMLTIGVYQAQEAVLALGKAVLTLFPNLESLNLKNYVATDAPIDLMIWYRAFGVSGIYTTIILSLGALIFSRRSFDHV